MVISRERIEVKLYIGHDCGGFGMIYNLDCFYDACGIPKGA